MKKVELLGDRGKRNPTGLSLQRETILKGSMSVSGGRGTGH